MKSLLATIGFIGLMILANYLGEIFATAIVISFFITVFAGLGYAAVKVAKNASR